MGNHPKLFFTKEKLDISIFIRCLVMLLNSFKKIKNNRKCLGRGISSGKGKTCGRGNKGQKSRSGGVNFFFEGGQNPIYKRLPKRGFISKKKNKYKAINIKNIKNIIEKTKKNKITINYLKKFLSTKLKIKIVGNWNIIDYSFIEVNYASQNIIVKALNFGSIINVMNYEYN